MSTTLISVIIPVYNCERYLAGAIESVRAQTWRHIETVVVDDGSTDGSAAVAKRFGSFVKYELQPHAGPGAARNRGVELAQGEYLAFLDADDLWVENKLEVQMAAFGSDTPPDAVFGHVEQFLSPDLSQEFAERMYCPAGLVPGRFPGTMLIGSETFRRVGPFSVGLRVAEFIEWYSRATELGLKDVMLPQMVLRRRIHATNSGIVHRDASSDYVRVVKAALDRRRQRVARQGEVGTDFSSET
jgi:glycosyltransferase involved in cell wall biosynthesis